MDEFLEDVSAIAGTARDVGEVGLISSLFGPSARVLGDHWADKLSRKLSPKEIQNLNEHVSAVEDRLPNPANINVKPSLIADLIEWTDVAKSIDSLENPELAKAWQTALLNLLNDSSMLMNALNGLNETGIRALLRGGKADSHTKSVLEGARIATFKADWLGDTRLKRFQYMIIPIGLVYCCTEFFETGIDLTPHFPSKSLILLA